MGSRGGGMGKNTEFNEDDILKLLERMPKANPNNTKIMWRGKWRTLSELKEDSQFCQRHVVPDGQ